MDQETAEEVKRHFNVVAKGLRGDIRLVIEGVSANTERLDRVEVRLDGVEGRLERVEGRLDAVGGRLERVEVRLAGVESEIGEIKTMIRPLIGSGDA